MLLKMQFYRLLQIIKVHYCASGSEVYVRHKETDCSGGQTKTAGMRSGSGAHARGGLFHSSLIDCR